MWLGVLGPLLISDADGAIAVPAAKQRAVLAVLLVNANRVVPADELADMLWDGTPPAAARVTVRGLIRRLRLLLGPEVGSRIATRAHGYEAEFGTDELDVLRFAELHGDGGAALRAGLWGRCSEVLSEALGLWRDTPLCDVPCQRLQREEVPRLEQARLQAAEWQAEAELRLGHHERLIPQLQGLVAEQPLRERFHAQLMIALARCGRQAEALTVYRQARGALVDELGVEPGPELQDLHQRILGQDSDLIGSPPAPAARNADIPAAALQPRQLPAAIRHFAGRAGEVETLTTLLKDTAQGGPAVAIAAISGMAGVGKTALAVHFAHQAAASFPDGQLYANLRGIGPVTPATPGEVVRGFLDALGVPPGQIPAGLDELAALYRSVTAGSRLLIVLDNARDEQQVRPLLPGSPGSLVIVTGRSRLSGLAAAEGARLLSLDVLSGDDAHALLAGRLGNDRAGADPDAAAQIAALCGHLPLALGVTAARAAASPRFSLAALAAELRDAQSRLAALDVGDPAVSVRTVFSWSYAQLCPATASMFRLLGLHPGPDVSAPAAASLAGLPVSQARQALAELARVHLVTEPFPGRYGFHDLLRAYATEQAHAQENDQARHAATARILDHYLHTAAAAGRLLRRADSIPLAPPAPGVTPETVAGTEQALAWFDAEYNVLLSAVTLAEGTGFDSCAWQLPRAMARFLDRRGRWHEWAAVQRIARAAAIRLGDTTAQSTSVRMLACAHAMLGDYAQAEALLAECLQLSQSTADLDGELHAYEDLAWLAGDRLAHYAEAFAYSEQALALSQKLGDQVSEATTLDSVGFGHAMLGNYQQALIFCQRALDMYRACGNRTDEAPFWASLGYIHHQLGHFAEAADCHSRAVEMSRDIGDRFAEAQSLSRLGDTYHTAGDQAAARDAWEQALGILSDLHHPDAAQVRARFAARPLRRPETSPAGRHVHGPGQMARPALVLQQVAAR